MYSGKVLINTKLNLRKLIFHHKQQETRKDVFKYSLRQLFLKDKITLLPQLIFRSNLFESFHNQLLSIPRNLKNESTNLLRVWTHQCECVVAQRIRRGQQMFSLYTKLWEEQALKQFFKNIRQQVAKRGKECMLSAIGVSMYNWDRNRIPESEMRSHMSEIEYIKILKEKTVNCQICNKPDQLDKGIIAFCDCEGRKSTIQTFENWSVFIEQPDLIVWRRLHKSGSYEYKVYGSYNDVTAEDFLSVQIDTTYRKQWDPTAVALEVIERDANPESNSDLIYWEMQWPRLFANRDYVFNRRFLVDKPKKLVMVFSKGTEHPQYPTKSNKYRVEDYWSSMVIKPYTEITKPGLEFSLTYFDNPGVNIPSAVINWVAYRAMPDFLTRLRDATRKYKTYCITNNCKSIYAYHDDAKRTSNLSETPFDEDELFEIIKSEILEEQKPSQEIRFEQNAETIKNKNVKSIDTKNAELMEAKNAKILSKNDQIIETNNAKIDMGNGETIDTKNGKIVKSKNAEAIEANNAITIEVKKAETIETNAKIIELKMQNAEIIDTKNAKTDIIKDAKIEMENATTIKISNATINSKNTEAVAPPTIILSNAPITTPTFTPSSSSNNPEVILSPSPIMQQDQTYWKYLHPTYYLS